MSLCVGGFIKKKKKNGMGFEDDTTTLNGNVFLLQL